MKTYFKPIKSGKSVGEFKEEVGGIDLDSYEKTEDRKGNIMFRLFYQKAQTGIVVIMCKFFETTIEDILKEELKWKH